MKYTSREINRIAGEWAARIAAGDMSPREREELEAWLAADCHHLGAFGKSIAVLERLHRLQVVGSGEVRALIESNSPVWTRRRMIVTGGAATGLAAAAGLAAAVLWKDGGQHESTAPFENFSTRIGETRTITLSDNSILALNTNSRVSVSFSDRVRMVQLVQGEALFRVAKNKNRPFIVIADDTQVRAVGTSFTVRLLRERPIQIVVQEGVVEVTRRGSAGATPVRAAADTQTVVPHDAPIATHSVPETKVARTLAWQYGLIAFDNESLEDAADEFARYSNTKIVIEPAIARRTITGSFASNDPVGFAKATASALRLRTEVEDGEVRIYR